MKTLQYKHWLLGASLAISLFNFSTAFASETVTIPLIGDNKWHCSAHDNSRRQWSADGRDYDHASDNAIDACKKHSDHPRDCQVRRSDCHH